MIKVIEKKINDIKFNYRDQIIVNGCQNCKHVTHNDDGSMMCSVIANKEGHWAVYIGTTRNSICDKHEPYTEEVELPKVVYVRQEEKNSGK